MKPKSLICLWVGFFAGALAGACLAAADIRSDTFLLIMSFSLGVIVVMILQIVFPPVPTARPYQDREERKDDDWWQKGEPPPWDTYRHEDGDTV